MIKGPMNQAARLVKPLCSIPALKVTCTPPIPGSGMPGAPPAPTAATAPAPAAAPAPAPAASSFGAPAPAPAPTFGAPAAAAPAEETKPAPVADVPDLSGMQDLNEVPDLADMEMFGDMEAMDSPAPVKVEAEAAAEAPASFAPAPADELDTPRSAGIKRGGKKKKKKTAEAPDSSASPVSEQSAAEPAAEPAAAEGGSMYDAPAGGSMYDAPAEGSSMYDAPAGGSMYDAPAEGSSMYDAPAGGSMYDAPAGASMYDAPAGESMYGDTGGGGIYGDTPAPAPAGPERRVDPEDGEAYTQEEFHEAYGGLDEWNAATPAPAPAASMYDAPSAEPTGFNFGGEAPAADAPSGFNFGSDAPADEPAPALVGPEPTLAPPPSTGNFDNDMATIKSRISELADSQIDALKQSAALRGEVDTLKHTIADTTKQIDEAGAAEEYEKAEELSGVVDTKTAELKKAEAQLAAYTERYSKAEQAKEELMLKQVDLHQGTLETLKSHRGQQEATCSEFVNSNGPKLQGEESECFEKSDGIDTAKKSVVDDTAKVQADYDAVEQQVATSVAGPTAEKEAEDARLAQLNAKVEDLARQLAAATAERDESQAKLAGIVTVIDEERAKYTDKYAAIDAEKARIAQVDQQADSDRAAVEARQAALEKAWAQAEESRGKIVEAITGIAAQEDEHLHAIDEIQHAISLDKEMAKNEAEREAALSAPEAELAKLKADLDEFNLENASYTAEMAGIDGVIGGLEATIDALGQKIPALEGEQKAAAAARNFKEAGRLKKELTEAQGTREAKQAELTTQKSAKAAKEAENSEAAAKLVSLEASVTAQEKTIGSTQFKGLVQSIAEVQGRLAAVQLADPAADSALLKAKLELFTGQAEALTQKYSLGPVERPVVPPATISTRERTPVSTPELPKPKPAMTEDEALECLRSFDAKMSSIEAELIAKTAAEDYDACDVLSQQQEELQTAHAVAQTIVPMTMAEATEITGSYTAESTRLSDAIAEKMAAEDYDACDAIQGELDALAAKFETASKLTGSGSAVSATVAEGVPPAAVEGTKPVEPQPAPASAPAEPAGMLGAFDFTASASAPAPSDAGGMLGGFDFSAPAPAADTPAADSFGKEEAAALLARIQELEAELDEKMAAEDYDRCEEINAEVEKLKEREEEAKALVSGRTGQDDDGDE